MQKSKINQWVLKKKNIIQEGDSGVFFSNKQSKLRYQIHQMQTAALNLLDSQSPEIQRLLSEKQELKEYQHLEE